MLPTRRLCCALVALTLAAPLGRPRTTAVVDRFEDDRAVLVTDDGETLAIPRGRLPAAGRAVNAVFRVVLVHGTLADLDFDPRATRERARRSRERFDRLAGRRSANGDRSGRDEGVREGGRRE